MYGLVLKEELEMVGGEVGEGKREADGVGEEHRRKQMDGNAGDWMVVEAVVNSGVKDEDLQLVGKLCEFWQGMHFPDEEWMPSVSPFGEVTWSSTVNYSSIDYCPYKEALISRI